MLQFVDSRLCVQHHKLHMYINFMTVFCWFSIPSFFFHFVVIKYKCCLLQDSILRFIYVYSSLSPKNRRKNHFFATFYNFFHTRGRNTKHFIQCKNWICQHKWMCKYILRRALIPLDARLPSKKQSEVSRGTWTFNVNRKIGEKIEQEFALCLRCSFYLQFHLSGG